MNTFPDSVKQNLITIIKEMSNSPAPFVKNPYKDFTRTRKLPFETVISTLITMGGNTLGKE